MDENQDSDTSKSDLKADQGNKGQNDKSIKCLQSNFSANSNDSCSEEIQTQSSSSKYSQHKELMNCIAFENKADSIKENGLWNEARYSDDFDSLSSDTTSDITDVSPPPPSPPPSSSGCSSMMKGDMKRQGNGHSGRKLLFNKDQKSYKRVSLKSGHSLHNKDIDKREEQDEEEEEEEHSLTFLKDALHNLDCQSSVKSGFSSVRQNLFPQQKNLTFNKEQMRNINRENMILLRKIQSNRNRSKLDTYGNNLPRVSSSAINRQRQQRKIEFENSILLQKIQRVKGTTNTMIGFRRF